MSILVIGSLNADRAFHLPRAPEAGETLTAHHMALAAGGKGANQAVAAARASRAARSVRMIGRVGADGDGEMMRAALIEAGVDAIGVQALPDRPTGTAFIVVEETGENRIIVSPGANEGLSPADIEAEDFADAGMVLLQLEVPLATVGAAAQKAAREGRTVILDPAPAPTPPSTLPRRPEGDADARLNPLRLHHHHQQPHWPRRAAPHGARHGAQHVGGRRPPPHAHARRGGARVGHRRGRSARPRAWPRARLCARGRG